MINYLVVCGAVANLIFMALIVASVVEWFIWPAVEAVSMVRYYKAIERAFPGQVKIKSTLKLFLDLYFAFGRDWESTRCHYGEWNGVGKWRVYGTD